MFNSEDIEEYQDGLKAAIPYNTKFEGIDAFGDDDQNAVEFIKTAIFSSEPKDIEQVMNVAVNMAIEFITSTQNRHSNDEGFNAKSRGNRRVFIDDLEVAALTKYMPLRLSRFLGGFQAERIVGHMLQQIKGVKVLSGKNLDLWFKHKFGIEGSYTADKDHQVDIVVVFKKKIYLLHVFKESSQDSVTKKVKNYMNRKMTHIVEFRHGITYKTISTISKEEVTRQFRASVTGDRVIKIKADGAVQFIDFESGGARND